MTGDFIQNYSSLTITIELTVSRGIVIAIKIKKSRDKELRFLEEAFEELSIVGKLNSISSEKKESLRWKYGFGSSS